MKVLYIGGTGEISYECVKASCEAGVRCTVFNRGRSEEPLPADVRQIVGDINDPAACAKVARERFDVVCQFIAYKINEIERDVAAFGGNCGQYVFISSASAYQKPPTMWRITEDVPLGNPFWSYSQAKANMEKALLRAHAQKKIVATIVRPSHTIRRRFPGTFVKGDVNAWRMLNDRPIIVHGDGTALWTLTPASAFAIPFVKLLGNAKAHGEAFHIASDGVYAWDCIINTMGEALGVRPKIVHMPADTIVKYNKDWVGPLLGDKAWSTTFDHAKLTAIVGALPKVPALKETLEKVAECYRERARAEVVDRELNGLLDRMAGEQTGLGQ